MARLIERSGLRALSAVLTFGAISAHAQDATWVGGHAGDPNEWLENNNWNPATIPTGTATFNTSAVTSVASSGLVAIGAVDFTNVSSTFTITNNDIFLIQGAGVANNNTGTVQTFDVEAAMVFQNSSSASAGPGLVTYGNNFQIFFQTNSSAGTARINNSGDLEFDDSSTAGSATIINTATLAFQDGSTAGTANTPTIPAESPLSTPTARAAAQPSSPTWAARSTYPG
jgi:hypothetical protein